MAKGKATVLEREAEKPDPGFITVEKVPGKYRIRRYNPDGVMLETWALDAFSKGHTVGRFAGEDGSGIPVRITSFDADPDRGWNPPNTAPLDGTEFEGKVVGDHYTIYQAISYDREEQVFRAVGVIEPVTITAWRPRLVKRKV